MGTTASKKLIYEEIGQALEHPNRETVRNVLMTRLGEFPNLDFKEDWPALSRVARHILGMANFGGGGIFIGVSEKEDKTLVPVGLDLLLDKSDFKDGVEKFLPDTLLSNIDVLDLPYSASEYGAIAGMKFQLVLVESDPKHLPFISKAQGDGIFKDRIYIRRMTSTEEANHEEIQSIINRRIQTEYSSQSEIDARTHIEQLKMLYSQIDSHHTRLSGGMSELLENISKVTASVALSPAFPQKVEKIPNPAYPEENFEQFIGRMITKKKKRIEIILDVLDLS